MLAGRLPSSLCRSQTPGRPTRPLRRLSGPARPGEAPPERLPGSRCGRPCSPAGGGFGVRSRGYWLRAGRLASFVRWGLARGCRKELPQNKAGMRFGFKGRMLAGPLPRPLATSPYRVEDDWRGPGTASWLDAESLPGRALPWPCGAETSRPIQGCTRPSILGDPRRRATKAEIFFRFSHSCGEGVVTHQDLGDGPFRCG
jgi:hypothetical protein